MNKEFNLGKIKKLTNEVETLKEENDVVDGKLARLCKSSKDLEDIIESQRSDQVKKGVGYNAVPPPAADLYHSFNPTIALMANLSHYGSDNLADVHNQDNVTNNVIHQILTAELERYKGQNSGNYEEPNLSTRTTLVEFPKELPKVSMVNSSLKKLKFHLASFDMVVKERTTAIAITKGTWGFKHTKACFRNEIIPFVKALKDLFNLFDQFLIDELTEVQNAFRIYNRRTRRIVETIHVDFDELTAMASERSSSGLALNEMTHVTISSGPVPKPSSSTPYVTPSRNDWDLLFQLLFGELLAPPPSVDSPAPKVIAPIADVIPRREPREDPDGIRGIMKFTNMADEIAYKMPHKIDQFNSLSDLEKEHTKLFYFRNEEDKRRGVHEEDKRRGVHYVVIFDEERPEVLGVSRIRAFKQETQDLDVEIKKTKELKASYGVTTPQELRPKVEHQLDHKIKVVRSDKGGECYGRHTDVGQALRYFFDFCKDYAIINHYIMPEFIQTEALKTAVHILNRVPSKSVSKHHMQFGQEENLAYDIDSTRIVEARHAEFLENANNGGSDSLRGIELQEAWDDSPIIHVPIPINMSLNTSNDHLIAQDYPNNVEENEPNLEINVEPQETQ
nr:hypothetical protein [Tanacetum cinerariifolium]